MKRLAIALVVIGLLTVSQVTHAANLEEGWYVKIGAVAFFGVDGDGMWGIDWDFTSPLETSGPFDVTQPDPLWPQRMVSVSTTMFGVPNGTAIYLYGQPRVPIQRPTTDLQITSETYYDASQMLIQLFVQHGDGSTELLWTEPRSGHHTGGGSVLWPSQTILPTDTIYFKVTAVPEPSSCLTVLLPLIGLLWMRRRMEK